MLSDLGLIGDPLTSQKMVREKSKFMVKYGHRVVLVENQIKLNISGIIPTALGEAIASLYDPSPNLLGQQIFEEWLGSLDKNSVQLTDIS